MTNWRVILEPNESGRWTVWCLDLPYCISQGDTKEEALNNIKEALLLHLEGEIGELEEGSEVTYVSIPLSLNE